MQTVVYNSPLYYFYPLYIQCILLLNYYRITIILILFSSRTSEASLVREETRTPRGHVDSILVQINRISSSSSS